MLLFAASMLQELPFTSDEYQLIPSSDELNKRCAWVPLGDHLSSLEKDLSDVDGNQYFTVRMDGKNFNQVYKELQQLGLFSPGIAVEYENIMVSVCSSLTNYFANVIYSYTQSDEITLLFSSTLINKVSQCHEPHIFSGRHDKIVSLTASLASQYFCKQLIQMQLMKFPAATLTEEENPFDHLPIVTFDARIAKFDTLKDAFQMVLWRSYDCSVNSASTALRLLYSSQKTCQMSKSDLNGLNTLKKVLLLHDENLLSQLTDHLKYGTLFYHGRDAASVVLAASDNGTAASDVKVSKRKKISTQKIPGQTIVNVKEGGVYGVCTL